MGKFLNALLNKPTVPSGAPYSSGAATVGQPVPVAFAHEPVSDLSSYSDIGHAAIGAWPEPLDSLSLRLVTIGGWLPNKLREVRAQNISGNYGTVTGGALFGFKWRAFVGIGNYANEGFSNPYVPEYNELVPITWGLRVPNPNTPSNTTQQKGSQTIQTKPSTWEGSNTASLSKSGVTLL